MKLITAIIKPSRLDAVLDAVTDAGASGLTVTEVRGYGRQKGKTEVYRGAEYEVKLLPKVKLEIAVTTDMVPQVMEAMKVTFAVHPRAQPSRVRRRPVLAPVPAGVSALEARRNWSRLAASASQGEAHR